MRKTALWGRGDFSPVCCAEYGCSSGRAVGAAAARHCGGRDAGRPVGSAESHSRAAVPPMVDGAVRSAVLADCHGGSFPAFPDLGQRRGAALSSDFLSCGRRGLLCPAEPLSAPAVPKNCGMVGAIVAVSHLARQIRGKNCKKSFQKPKKGLSKLAEMV